MSGLFVVSLDFELHWGVRDHARVSDYRDNLLGVRRAVPALLELFSRRGVHATWATVGMLLCRSKKDLIDSCPSELPSYGDPRLSPYDAFDEVGADEATDPFHFAPSLVEAIVATPGQELATHTFSHFYCLEPGQREAQFDADLFAANRMFARYGAAAQSIVFPRNQHNPAYDHVLARHGIVAMRTSGPHWAYRSREGSAPPYARAARLLDSYLPIDGLGGRRTQAANANGIVDVPSSRFLRPYAPRFRSLDRVRLHRITSAMRRAAHAGESFHLWWHPHNFGVNLAENMSFLGLVLDELDALRSSGAMTSVTMAEAAKA